ncbi:hypothetical protein Tsubulata_000940 [Turnera subulata]|uniref:Cytochrome P450 n=1 Tax=Turnera subulata TaxID=218843 RepID=A0A9Q0G390_9ROSI|nr:hypothetical protein Tsubulata_000940 [Turnera subulata]
MEVFHSLVVIVVVIVTTTWAWRLLNSLWLRPRKLERLLRQQGFHGRPYRFLAGDLRENATLTQQARSRPIPLSDDIIPRVIPFLHQTFQEYGKNSFTWMAPKPRVNIQNPEHVKEVFTKINDFQRTANSNPYIKYLVTGLASYDGEKWANHRKIVNPAFHLEKLKLMTPILNQSCNEMIKTWEELIPKEGSCEIDVWPFLQNLTCDVIARAAFGSNYEEGKRIFDLLKEQTVLVIQALQSGYLPGWRFVPTKTNNRIKANYKEIEELLKPVIKKREESIHGRGDNINGDVLGLLVESNYREIREQSNKKKAAGMSSKDVIEECKLFYFAGQETTSVLLVWTMILLGHHQIWQTRAREEILEVFGDKEPDFDGLNQLKVVTMILNEVLRLYPPVVLIGREVPKDIKVGDAVLPGGVQVALPTILIHRDPEIWGEDASEFKPERFMEGVAKATKNQVCFFPFGWGPRICIGLNFAMVEAKIALALILRNYCFQLGPSYTHAPHAIITLQPQHGAHLLLHRL